MKFKNRYSNHVSQNLIKNIENKCFAHSNYHNNNKKKRNRTQIIFFTPSRGNNTPNQNLTCFVYHFKIVKKVVIILRQQTKFAQFWLGYSSPLNLSSNENLLYIFSFLFIYYTTCCPKLEFKPIGFWTIAATIETPAPHKKYINLKWAQRAHIDQQVFATNSLTPSLFESNWIA